MKKFLAIAVVALLGFFSASAGEWDIFSLMFTEDMPNEAALANVYGIKVGVPICGGSVSVYGVEAAVVWAGTKDVKGVKCAIIGSKGQTGSGLQLSLVNVIDKFAGLQLGLVNYATDEALQFGLVNVIKNSSVPFLPFVNCRF